MSHHSSEPKPRRHSTTGVVEEHRQPIVSKQAFVFLCLFDGYRIPSIRRLMRKPQTVCFEPLLNYNPKLSTPATKEAVIDRYQSKLSVNCTPLIDPSIDEVMTLITPSLSRPLNERLIIHYFGQGSISPSKSGAIFFFDKTHSTYKGIQVGKIIPSAAQGSKTPAPVALIIDVNSAGALCSELHKILQSKSSNFIAFLSCDKGETLPAAPSLPYDILSSAILFPSKTAIWFQAIRSSLNVKDAASLFTESDSLARLSADPSFLSFLNSVIDSIAYSKLDQNTYDELLFEDPALTIVTRGFILAQRILRYHNIHSISVPELPDFADSELWAYLDFALDMTFSQGTETFSNIPGLFEQLTVTFTNFPHYEVLPIICHFLTNSKYYERTQNILFEYIDQRLLEIPASLNTLVIRSLVPHHECLLLRPTTLTFLILGKLVYIVELSIIEIKPFLSLLQSAKDDETPASIFAATCSMNKLHALTATQREFLLKLCYENAAKASPYSQLLYSFIAKLDSELTFGNQENEPKEKYDFVEAFGKVLQSHHREDSKMAAAYALALTHNFESIKYLIHAFLNDSSEKVRFECGVSLSTYLKFIESQNDVNHHMKYVDMINEAAEKVLHAETHKGAKSDKHSVTTALDAAECLQFLVKKIKQFPIPIKDENEESKSNPNIGKSHGGSVGFSSTQMESMRVMMLRSTIPELFKKSIVRAGLIDRFMHNFFNVK